MRRLSALFCIVTTLLALVAAPAYAATRQELHAAAEAAEDRNDWRKAFALWLEIADESGDPHAQYSVGYFLEHGKGVGQDLAQAAEWYRRAASKGRGLAQAQADLGGLYFDGRGVPQDDVQAYAWFDRAAANFEDARDDQRHAAQVMRAALAARMTKEQIAQAQRFAGDLALQNGIIDLNAEPPCKSEVPVSVQRETKPLTGIGRLKVEHVNVRVGPGTTYCLSVALLAQQSAVQVLAENGIWLQVKYDGATGWVVGGLVER